MRLFQRNEHSKREHTPTGGDERITAIVYVKDNEKSIFNNHSICSLPEHQRTADLPV